MKKKKGFLLYNDYYEHIKLLTNEETGLLTKALFEYAENKTKPNFEGSLAMAFSFIHAQMDRDGERYEETCRKRAEAGRLGGRAKRNTTNVFFAKQNVANEADNDVEINTHNNIDTNTDNDTDNNTDTNTDTGVKHLPKGPFAVTFGEGEL